MDYFKLIPAYAGKAVAIIIGAYLVVAYLRGKTKSSDIFVLFFAVSSAAILYSKFSVFFDLLWNYGTISIAIQYAGTIEVIYLVAGTGAAAYFATSTIVKTFIKLFQDPQIQLEEEGEAKVALLTLLYSLKSSQEISEADYKSYKSVVAPESKKTQTPWETMSDYASKFGKFVKDIREK